MGEKHRSTLNYPQNSYGNESRREVTAANLTSDPEGKKKKKKSRRPTFHTPTEPSASSTMSTDGNDFGGFSDSTTTTIASGMPVYTISKEMQDRLMRPGGIYSSLSPAKRTPAASTVNTSVKNMEPTRPDEPFKTFEEALESVNPFGRYQIFTCIVIQYASILWAGNYSFMQLGVVEPDWKCNEPRWNGTLYEAPTNRSDAQFCEMMSNCSDKVLPVTNYFKSIVQEWKLVCDLKHVPSVILFVYLGGRIVGSIVGGHIGDHLGRRRGFFTAQFFIIITSVMAIASTRWEVFAAFQSLNGFFFGIISVTSMTLMMEYTDSKHRLIPNAMFQWMAGYMVIALIGYLTADWKLYLIIVNLCAAPLLVGYLLFHESPRWLITKGKLFQAAEALNDIASDRWNNTGILITKDDLVNLPTAASQRPYTFLHLFGCKRLASQSLLQMICIFTYSLINANYFYNVDSVPGGPFVHLFLYGILRLWVPILVIYLDWHYPKFGRKTLLLSSLAVSGVCYAVNIVLLEIGLNLQHPAVVTFTIIGTTVNVTGFYMAIIQITTAAYPTVIRSIAFGTLHICDDIGQVLANAFIDQAEKFWTPMPYIIPLALIVLSWILAYFFQPETKGKPLMDRYAQAKKSVAENALF